MLHRSLSIPCATLFALLLSFTSCHRTCNFTITGHIDNADGETLYLEHTALTQTTIVDSCLLSDGAFTLHAPMPEYPDFYRLRIGNKHAVIVLDSIPLTEVHTTADSLPYTTLITGSDDNQRIALLRQSIRTSTIDEHRAFAQRLIMEHPRSMAAYYAIFQSKGGEPVFDLYTPAQRRYYQVVATSMNVWMPDYERTKALYAQVLSAINDERKAANTLFLRQYIEESEQAFLDIALPNIYGDTCLLSSHRGKVILLDFSSSQIEHGNAYVLALRDLDNKYHTRGLDIYSVSVDPVKLYWEDWVRNLPWTCVRTETFDPLITYNVTTLPTLFLIDRHGNIQGRYNDFDALDKAIKAAL